MNFFQHSNEHRGSFSSGLASSTSQYRTSFLEETPKHQNLKDERIRNIKSKLQSIPSQNSKYEDNNISIFNVQHSSLQSQSYSSQNQNINNINLLQGPLYQQKSNSNNFIQPQQKSYLGVQINMERKQKSQIRGSIRSENEEEQTLVSMREKNALFYEEDESRRRSFTPSQSQSSSNESFTKNQQPQKAGGFFGNKLQEIKLRRFQIDAAKLIIDRLVKVCYKSFNDIYDYSLKKTNRNSLNNQNINIKLQTKQNSNEKKINKDLKLKIVNNNQPNQVQGSSSFSQVQKKFDSDICLSDRKSNQNSSNFNIHQQSQHQIFQQQQHQHQPDMYYINSKSKLQQPAQQIYQNSSDNLKFNDRKLSIQINVQNSKPLYRHISPCDRLSTNSSSNQVTRNRNVSSIISNNNTYNNNNHSSGSFHFSMSQNNNFNSSPTGQFGNVGNNYSQSQLQGNNQQYYQQLSNSFNNLENNLRRASSHENKINFIDNSFENGFGRQKSSEKIQLAVHNNQSNSQERSNNNSTFEKMMLQMKQNNNQTNQLQQKSKINNENSSLFSQKTNQNFQKQSINSQENQFLRQSPQRKSTGGYIQNNISIPKSFLDSSQRPLSRQSHSSQHLNSYFQTSFFKQINEDPQNSQHNIHQQTSNQDKPYESCHTEQSFIRMSTNGTRNQTNNNGDLLTVRINTNESNNYNFANVYTNRGSYRENDQTSDNLLTSSFQKSINNQLRQEIENRRSFKNQKQDSLDGIFDDLNAKKGGSLIDCEEENDMKVSSIQKLKQEFNEIIKSSFQNEIKQSSFKKEEQQKIFQSTSNRVSFNNLNENEEQSSHNIYNQNNQIIINVNSNPQLEQNQQISNKNSQQNDIKQAISDSFQAQLLKQQHFSTIQRGQQDERNCISARNNTSAFIVENLLNQEEVKSFSCYDEDLIKQQDITIQQLSTKNQNTAAEQSNFKDDLIFDKTVHSFDFNLSLRESENNLKQKLNMQQDLSQSSNENQTHSNQNTSQKKYQISSQKDGNKEQNKNEQQFENIQHNMSQQQRKENVQFNGSFGRLSVDSTPRNNEEMSQLDNSKKPLSHFARLQSEEEEEEVAHQNEGFLNENNLNNEVIQLDYNQENQNMNLEQQPCSNKQLQQQQQLNQEGEEGDEESSRFSFELKNTLDEFQSQQHLEQILFNQNNQTTNEDISIIEKNNKSNFSIFIDKNDRNNMSIFNSNNEELLNTVTNSQINFQQHNQNNQHDNILIAQSFPYSSSGNNFNKNEVQDYNDISFDQNQHRVMEDSNKKQYFENAKKTYQEDNVQKHFGETKKQLFMDSNQLTQSNESTDQNNDAANLMIITQIIQGNSSLQQESLRAKQQQQKEEMLEKFQQKIYFNNINETNQNQVDMFDDEQILFEASEFTPPRHKKINPINQYPMSSNAESSPIIDKEIVQGGLGLKVFEFSLKLQTIMKAIQMKNLRESFISIVIYSQLKSYLMSAYQQQLQQQQQQSEQLYAQRVAQIQNIPYYYQSQFSTIYEQQNETCSDIYQPQSINASKLLDSRSLYDSKSLEQFNLEMNKVTIFNSLQFTSNQMQNASSQHITHSSIIESNVSNSQNTSLQPQQNFQNVMHTEIVTEIDSNDNGIKQFWGLSIISSRLQNQLKQVFNCWKNSQNINKKNQIQMINFAKKIQLIQQKKLKDAFNILKNCNYQENFLNFRVKIVQFTQILERLEKNFMKQAFQNLKINQIQRKQIFEQQMRYSLYSMISIMSNTQQDNLIWSLKQLKKQTIYKTKLVHVLHEITKQKMNQVFIEKLKSLFDLKKRREFALQPVLFNFRRCKNQLLSKYQERWRMQLYHKSTHFDKFSGLSNLSGIFKQNIQTSQQLAFKKIQLNSLKFINREKFLKNILLKILLYVENKKKELKQIGFEQIFSIYQFKKHRQSVLQNLIKSKILKEQQKYFHVFYKRVYENKNHVQFIKTGIKSLLLMGQILQGKINQNLLYAFKCIQFFNMTKRKINTSTSSVIDVLNIEHESIKLTLKSLKNNLQKVKIESLMKGLSHIQQKFQYNQQKKAFGKMLQNCRQKKQISKGVSLLSKIQTEQTKKKIKASFSKLKILIQDKLQLKKNQKSQKQIFCFFLKTLLQKKLQNMKRTALLSIKEKADQFLQEKRDKKLIYTESSMFVVKCKLLLGTLDKIFKKNLYQYPFQLIYGCQPQKYIAAMQFYQNLTNQTQKVINQSKKPKSQQQTQQQLQQSQSQSQKSFHASNLLQISKSKSPIKRIQEQHNAKHEIIKNLVSKNEEQKQQISQTNNKKEQISNQKGRVNQNQQKQNQNQAQNDNKPKTSQSQIIPSQHRNQSNQQSNVNQFKSQIITPTNQNQSNHQMNNIIYQGGFNQNQMVMNDEVDELSLSSKAKCITFGGSSSPKQRDFQSKQNCSIPNIINISSFIINQSPISSERIITSSSNIISPQNNNTNKQSIIYEGQKQQQQVNLNNNQKLPYFQHNRNFSSGSTPSSSQPITNISNNSSSSMIIYNSTNMNN